MIFFIIGEEHNERTRPFRRVGCLVKEISETKR